MHAAILVRYCRHYTTEVPNPPGGLFEPGLAGMPAVVAAYKAIGKEIISGNQGDIDFGLFGLPADDEELLT